MIQAAKCLMLDLHAHAMEGCCTIRCIVLVTQWEVADTMFRFCHGAPADKTKSCLLCVWLWIWMCAHSQACLTSSHWYQMALPIMANGGIQLAGPLLVHGQCVCKYVSVCVCVCLPVALLSNHTLTYLYSGQSRWGSRPTALLPSSLSPWEGICGSALGR